MRLQNPITAQVDYTDDECQFLAAVERYKRENGRLFPTYRELLAVAVSLGYRRVAEPGELPTFKGGKPERRRRHARSRA